MDTLKLHVLQLLGRLNMKDNTLYQMPLGGELMESKVL